MNKEDRTMKFDQILCVQNLQNTLAKFIKNGRNISEKQA